MEIEDVIAIAEEIARAILQQLKSAIAWAGSPRTNANADMRLPYRP